MPIKKNCLEKKSYHLFVLHYELMIIVFQSCLGFGSIFQPIGVESL